MYVVKFAFLLIVGFTLSRSCVLAETLKKFLTFCHFSFEGGGGVKKETKAIRFLSDIDILT